MSYIRKPIPVEAFLFTHPLQETPAWFNEAMMAGTVYYQGGPAPYMTIETAVGPLRADTGDWIVCEDKTIYPCKSDTFEQNYEMVVAPEPRT